MPSTAGALRTLENMKMVQNQRKSISDDDLCATCSRCDFRPGELSSCRIGFPGEANADDYITACKAFAPTAGSEQVRGGL